MELKIYSLSVEQASKLEGFMLPYVSQMPDNDRFWYFAAATPEAGFIGMVVIAPYIPEAELLSIAVSPAYTRRGVASELLNYAIEKMYEAEIFELRMTYALPPLHWNAMDNLMIRNGFQMDDTEKRSYIGTLKDLQIHSVFAKTLNSSNVYSIKDLSSMETRSLSVKISEDGDCDPIVLQECNPEYSFVWKENGEIQALFLLSDLENRTLTNLYTWLESNAPKKLIAVMQQALKKVISCCPLETEVIFNCMDDVAEHLVLYFLPEAKPVSILRSYLYSTINAVDTEDEEDDIEEAIEIVSDRDRSDYWSDVEMLPVDDSDLYCHDCKYRTEGIMTSCIKYKMKPGNVLYGAPCRCYVKGE